MGRKPRAGLRQAILAAASVQRSSAAMLREALERDYGAEPTTLTGVIKAADGLRSAGLLQAAKAMPEVYRGARTRTYYSTTAEGKASLQNAIASATAGWNGSPAPSAAQAEESRTNTPLATVKESRKTQTGRKPKRS